MMAIMVPKLVIVIKRSKLTKVNNSNFKIEEVIIINRKISLLSRHQKIQTKASNWTFWIRITRKILWTQSKVNK